MAIFKLKSDLPASAQAEITRILAISSAQRTTAEANYLTARDPYLYNEAIVRDSSLNIVVAKGRTLPTGDSGFAPGAFFTLENATAEDSPTYQNVGDTSAAVWRAVGGHVKGFTIASAAVLALHTTPVSLVAAPGAGKLIMVDEIVAKMTFLTAAYTGGNALEFRYTDGSGVKVSADLPATLLNAASGSIYGSVKGVVSALVPAANAAVVAVVPVADPAAGAGTLTGFIRYHTVTL